MISTEHLRAEPYIYRTEPNHHIPARKINRTVPYRGYVRLAGLGVKHLNCRYPIYTSCSRYKMNTNYTLPDPEERYDTSQRSYTITFRLQFLSELTVGMLSYKI